MKTTAELKNALANFYGTDSYHFNPMYKRMLYTDGVKFFFENAGNGAYWFSDILGTEVMQVHKKEAFLHITLSSDGGAGLIEVDDGNDNILWSRTLDYTDCPDGDWHFYLVDNVLMLTSEY
jgi:hypothetical protein